MSDTAVFVQFPHPGQEHHPPTDDMPWNPGPHRRKFLVGSGRHIDGDGRPVTSEQVFWGEWEAPSRIVHRWPAARGLPRALHRPYWTRPTTRGFRQNTDPWVFGDHILYSNCKQVTGPEHRPTSMQSLPPGSVICFGSTIDHEFCLDTVLVVAYAEPWTPGTVAESGVDETFAVCTAGSIIESGGANRELTLYRGGTFEQPLNGMYSYVPALPVIDDQAPRFARPVIVLPGLINAANRQSTRGSRRPLALDKLHDAWQAVLGQVLDAGLVPAVHLATPPPGEPDAVPAPDHSRC